MYGHVEKLAEEIRKGAASVEGVEAKLWQVNCLLVDELLHCRFSQAQSDFYVYVKGFKWLPNTRF